MLAEPSISKEHSAFILKVLHSSALVDDGTVFLQNAKTH
jgi:hypothetical protein